jgi:glycine/D-amino acid oxidase-like deaminating enzyme
MNRSSAGPEVVVVGGGISGCAVALELLARGVQVTVVDRR